MTIAEAAKQVLRKHDRPMTLDKFYDAIITNNLFHSNTPQPNGVLRSQLRRHYEGPLTHVSAAVTYFVVEGDGRYSLKRH